MLMQARERGLEAELEALKQRQGRAAAALSETRRACDGFKDAYEAAVAEDKQADKLANFKKEFADAEAYVDVLYKLFRRRKHRSDDNKPAAAPPCVCPLSGVSRLPPRSCHPAAPPADGLLIPTKICKQAYPLPPLPSPFFSPPSGTGL